MNSETRSVLSVNEVKNINITMKGEGLKKLTGGYIVEMAPMKVPRVIGRGGSMINTLKTITKCRIFVGQNGRVWVAGEVDDINAVISSIKKIDEESHTYGLTEKIKKHLEEYYSLRRGEPDGLPPKS